MRTRGGIGMGSSEISRGGLKELESAFKLKIEPLWKILEEDMCLQKFDTT